MFGFWFFSPTSFSIFVGPIYRIFAQESFEVFVLLRVLFAFVFSVSLVLVSGCLAAVLRMLASFVAFCLLLL